MVYRDLHNETIYTGGLTIIDINDDGIPDFRFVEWEYASPGDNAMKQEFFIFTYEHSFTLTDDVSFTTVREKSASIKTAAPEGFEWANVSNVILVRNIKNAGTGSHTWYGNWLNVQHKFLPVQITVQNKIHTGWIEISLDTTTPKLILHKAAWSKEPDTDIIAGK